jgi:hypothetical protein
LVQKINKKMPTTQSPRRILEPDYVAEHPDEFVKTNAEGTGYTTSSGGGGSVTIYGPYESNAAAILAGRSAGDLYKSTTLINGSPIILITA